MEHWTEMGSNVSTESLNLHSAKGALLPNTFSKSPLKAVGSLSSIFIAEFDHVFFHNIKIKFQIKIPKLLRF